LIGRGKSRREGSLANMIEVTSNGPDDVAGRWSTQLV
jgi:hypothetical protein